jgi:hypothetical protein
MGRRAEDYIPANILAAAEKAGLSTPLLLPKLKRIKQ